MKNNNISQVYSYYSFTFRWEFASDWLTCVIGLKLCLKEEGGNYIVECKIRREP